MAWGSRYRRMPAATAPVGSMTATLPVTAGARLLVKRWKPKMIAPYSSSGINTAMMKAFVVTVARKSRRATQKTFIMLRPR